MKKDDRKWYPVRIYFPAIHSLQSFEHEDEIRGTSPENALENAYWNWPDADKVELRGQNND
jgi:hypothetical protein